ncbi:MAG: YegS/Rv2252/BmrU family lipid kinase [Lachnospiraceae bacterium]|nr:YegS/Rv2252/BmrU family lipid kinase [Lachnospiraceae bacterium]
MRRVLIIINPNAGKEQIKGKLTDILDAFTKAGYWTEVYVTQRPGDATTIARTEGARFERVVCCGGDGTLDETLNGLMQLPTEKRPELGYISAGTTNDFAHSLALPADMKEAAAVAAHGKSFAIDVGKMNDTYFSYTVGFGAFTDVSYATRQDLKKVLGHQAYIMEGAREITNLRAHHMVVEANGKTYEGDYLLGMISNSLRVAGITGVWGEDIDMDDGLFEVNLLRQPGDLVGWGDLITAFFVTHEESEHITRLKTDHITFHSEEPINWVQDGEFGGSMTDVNIEVLLHALRIIRAEK